MKKPVYTRSLILMFLFAMIIAPATVSAHETMPTIPATPPMPPILVSIPTTATIQPLTGAALSADTLPTSLTEELYTYLIDGFTTGLIDADRYNQLLNSNIISENGFFSNSVFVGDSITVGFEKYCKKHSDSIKTDTTYFLARTSCSAGVAISKNALTRHSGIMPIYNGKAEYIEKAIAQMDNVEKVFICFGVNDLVSNSPEKFVNNMHTLISRILEQKPDVKIYVISTPCVMSDVSTGSLNNRSIQSANVLLQDMCRSFEWGYINLSEYLMGNDTGLLPKYSADNYVHENNAAYEVWNKVLKNYAFSEITK